MQTIRQKIVDLLSRHEMDARELSQELGIREREVYTHLAHVARSVKAEKKKLIVYPSQCLLCGYVFDERKRFTRPGRCPQCKKSHLTRPMFQVK
jgi:predicted Zn-ribbon and HTH transcriptional regulator